MQLNGSLRELWRQRTLRRNIILLSVEWAVCSFNFYLLSFLLKYIHGNIYVNSIVSSVADMIAYSVSGYLFSKLKVKKSLLIYWTVAFVGGIVLLILEGVNANDYLVATFVMISRLGMSSSFNTVYLSTPYLFPVIYCSTCMGIFNFWARLVAVVSPVIAEIDYPIPMCLFSGTAAIAFVFALFIKEKVPKLK